MLWAYLKRSFGFWFAGGWLVLSIVPALIGFYEGWRAHRNLADYYPAQATIIDKYTTLQNRGRLHYIEFGYLARDGKPHQGKADVPASDWEQYHEGNGVDVYVSGADPDDAWLQTEGEPSYVGAFVGFAIAAGVMIPAGLVTLLFMSRASRRARIVREGRFAPGRVEREVIDRRFRVNGRYWPYLVWSFEGPAGRQEGTTPYVSPERSAQFPTGGPIAVYVIDQTDGAPLAEADVYRLRANG